MSKSSEIGKVIPFTVAEAQYVGVCAAITMIGAAGSCGVHGTFTPAFSKRLEAISNDPELQAIPDERLKTIEQLEEFITMILDSTGCP